jgi:hypothetical protein
MHCLEVIVARNERAAAREEAHAVSDGNWDEAARIALANFDLTNNYMRAYERAREEK